MMGRMKRFAALVCCLTVLFGIIPMTAAAAQTPVLTVESTGGRRGDTVTVAVTLDAPGGIAGGSFRVEYDASQLTLLGAERGEALSNVTAAVNPNYAVNAVRLSFAGLNPLPEAGVLCVLTFRINQGAALGGSLVAVVGESFYDVNSDRVAVETVPGTVTAQSVTLSLNTTECLPGQAVVLEATLSGELMPAGGEFEIHYNARMLDAGSVKAETVMGTVGVNVSANVDYAEGVIKVSWAAAEAVTELGRLCTVIFAVSDTARGETPVILENVKFFDEQGNTLDTQTVNGSVTAVESYNPTATLYLVGGTLREDGTAVVQIAVDGAGVVCGGQFTLDYDPQRCTLRELKTVKSCAAVNPASAEAADGRLLVSWAENSPALDNETILELIFQLQGNEAAELTLSDVVLRDKNGEAVENVRVHGGQIGVKGSVQTPVTEVVNTENTVEITAILYDAAYCEESSRTQSAWVLCAGYVDGKLKTVTLPVSSVKFDHNGIATMTMELEADLNLNQMRMFTLSGEETMLPLCEKVQLEVAS